MTLEDYKKEYGDNINALVINGIITDKIKEFGYDGFSGSKDDIWIKEHVANNKAEYDRQMLKASLKSLIIIYEAEAQMHKDTYNTFKGVNSVVSNIGEAKKETYERIIEDLKHLLNKN